ncbi:MAG: ABC transporter ATP-binding protein [Ardenticatenia bacterium]|nr:ABC transporter ATP-binding protein [Ardenticatenia bacterium]
MLQGIALGLRPGDVVALLGPNGAGKTTLVRQIIGLERPHQGRVLINGRDTRSMTVAQIAATVGYVFQNPTLMLFAPTVWEEIAFGPRNLGFDEPRVERNVRRSLEIVDLTGHEHTSPLALSYGQQRRVGIGAVLAMGSKLLIMDEPTAGQDYRHYTRFMDAVVRMPFQAMLFITHDVDLAIRYANRVVLMAEGRVQADGPPEDVLSDFALLERCRVRPTSLLDLNVRLLPHTGQFLPLESLGAFVDGE